jgi:hypothetical protein
MMNWTMLFNEIIANAMKILRNLEAYIQYTALVVVTGDGTYGYRSSLKG